MNTFKNPGFKTLLVAFLFLFMVLLQTGAPTVRAQSNEVLRAVTYLEGPWVMQDANGELYGFHWDLWEAIAKEAGLEYEPIILGPGKFGDMITMVENGTADIAIQHIGVNERREPVMNFTHEIFPDGIQIIVSKDRYPLVSALKAFMDPQTLQVIGLAVLVLLVIAHLVWLSELSHPESEFPKQYFQGILHSLSWAILTVISQEGIVAKNRFGRVVSAIWFFFLLFALSAFTAQLATAFTVGRLSGDIKSVDDLLGKKVGTWVNGKQVRYLREHNIEPVFSENDHTDELIAMLRTGQIDALVLDIGNAYYFVNEYQDLAMAGDPVRPSSVAYPIIKDRYDLVEKINQAFLNLKAAGVYERIYEQYIGVPPGTISE